MGWRVQGHRDVPTWSLEPASPLLDYVLGTRDPESPVQVILIPLPELSPGLFLSKAGHTTSAHTPKLRGAVCGDTAWMCRLGCPHTYVYRSLMWDCQGGKRWGTGHRPWARCSHPLSHHIPAGAPRPHRFSVHSSPCAQVSLSRQEDGASFI